MGFFDYWFDNDWRQRSDINRATGEAVAAAHGVEILQEQVATLRPLVNELSATVAVLLRMLAEAGQLDPKVLQYRVEAELEERRTWRPHAAPPAPISIPAIRCTKCQREVPPETTIMTATGAVCDPACAR